MKPVIKAALVLGLFSLLFLTNRALAGSLLMVGIPLTPPPPNREAAAYRPRRDLFRARGHSELRTGFYRHAWQRVDRAYPGAVHELLIFVPDKPKTEIV